MTVGELIDKLGEMDRDCEVLRKGDDGEPWPISAPEVMTCWQGDEPSCEGYWWTDYETPLRLGWPVVSRRAVVL
jgi:hypothetical protein